MDYIIHAPEKIIETGQVFEIANLEEKEKLSRAIKDLDSKWGLAFREYDYYNNYENDDYLVVAGLLQTVRDIHRKVFFIPQLGGWQNGNSEIPYIQLRYIQKAVWMRDKDGNVVPNDRGLNMGVNAPLFNGSHILEFNYYWLSRYMSFLQNLFDKNEELFTELPSSVPKQATEYADKSELNLLAIQLEKSGAVNQANQLRIYAESAMDGRKIQKPVLTFFEIAGKQECVTWAFYDEDRHGYSIPAKKGIYNTSAFAPLFNERNELIHDIFSNTIKFVLGHETAHVARGHWKLRVKEPKFSYLRNVMMNCELNADWTAAHWLIDELLYITASGNLYDPVLKFSKDKLIYYWAVRIFSCYLGLSWVYREDREWKKDIITTFRSDMKATHPIFNFRLYNLLGKVKNHLNNDYILKRQEVTIKSVDGYELNEIAKEAWDKACDMIMSFETAFRISWNEDERDMLKKLKDSLYIDNKSRPDSKERIPFMLAYFKEAQDEFAGYEKLWPTIYSKLILYGASYIS